MDKIRLLTLLAISWPAIIPSHALAAGAHTTFGAHSCTAIPDVPDQDRSLALCAQIAQTGDTMSLIAMGPAGVTCLGRVLYAYGLHRARLTPDGEQLATIGTNGHLYWHWSAAANAQYGQRIDAFVACGRASSTSSDEREVFFTVQGATLLTALPPERSF
jgi:hypothetical protein